MSVLALYRGATRVATPLARAYLRRRLADGKEDAARIEERLGSAGAPRPPGPLVWVHGASVGESLSVLPLIERCVARRPDLRVLVTTGTVTSARLLGDRLPVDTIHQFAPLDLPGAVERFLGHWRPDLALRVESELWPNALGALGVRGVPALLVNARISARSFARWSRVPGAARALLGTFRAVLAQTEADAARFARLGGPAIQCVGNLKADAPPLPYDAAAFARLSDSVAGRPVWVAASTHPGEEEPIAAAHRAIAAHAPDVLTIVVPRHPARGAEVAARLGQPGALRSTGQGPTGPIHVADTLGELGLFFRLAGAAFVGGSLVHHGGHNPLEPARLGKPVLFGPHMDNFADLARDLMEAGGAVRVNDADDLAGALLRLLLDPALAARHGAAAELVAHAKAGALDRTMAVVTPLLDALPQGHAHA